MQESIGIRGVDYGENTGLTVTVKTDNTVLPVSVADFKAYAKIDTTADDALISDMLYAVKDMGESHTRLTWFSKVLIAEWETHGRTVDLPYGPHGAIVRVQSFEDGEYVTLTSDEFTITGGTFKTLTFKTWGAGLRVEYNAGYGAASTNLPKDLRIGALKAGLSAYEDRQNLAEGGFTDLKGTAQFYAGNRRIQI
jgi:uncharacterized phiE125 gp8 family phage protein